MDLPTGWTCFRFLKIFPVVKISVIVLFLTVFFHIHTAFNISSFATGCLLPEESQWMTNVLSSVLLVAQAPGSQTIETLDTPDRFRRALVV